MYPLGLIAQTGSVYCTLCVTIERYIVICWPLRYVIELINETILLRAGSNQGEARKRKWDVLTQVDLHVAAKAVFATRAEPPTSHSIVAFAWTSSTANRF